ncbi:MAG: SagB family peptide dehydrogenase [Candidatus Pacebacteria bacterium]|nr:SagB family peptide dehydrogenase [Candidatus Paceibacterota bacterium]
MMNIDNSYLYLTCGGYPKDNETWVFFTSVGEVEIKNANSLITRLLPLCNGNKQKREIIKRMEHYLEEGTDLDAFIADLFDMGILSDKFSVYKAWKSYGENPMIFFEEISSQQACRLIKKELPRDETIEKIKTNTPDFYMKGILNKRCSTREFAQEGVLKIEDIAGLFWSAYGVQEEREKIWRYGKEKTYTVPSGGGLYPLVLYLIELKDTQELTRGVYRWNGQALSFEKLKKQGCLDNLESMVTGIDSLEKATGIIVVAADYGRSAVKYSNKAYPLILLEAGHAMQNAYLYCAEKNIGFVELSGFEQKDLSDTLKLNKKLDPVVLGVFGVKKED